MTCKDLKGDGGMEKDIQRGILLSHENGIMPFAATQMDVEIIILSGVSQTETNITRHCLYVESKKKMVQMSLF